MFDDPAHLFEQSILTQVFALIAESSLVGATVVVMPFLNLSRDCAATSGAVQEAGERKLMLPSPFGFAFDMHDFLRLVEQSFAHNWLENAREQLAIQANHTVVDMVLQHLLDVGDREHFAFACTKAEASEFIAEREKRVCSRGVEFKSFADDGCFLRVWFDVAFFTVVHIPKRRRPRPLASAHFLAHAALHVFGKVVHIVLGLTESDIEHEFPLRCWLKPERRKLQSFELAGVQKMHDFSSIHAVPGEPVWVPCEDAIGSSFLYNFQHSGELGSPGLFCGFGLAERGDDFQLFVCGILLQLTELRINGEDLTIFLFCRFTTVRNNFHVCRISEKSVAGGGRERGAVRSRDWLARIGEIA